MRNAAIAVACLLTAPAAMADVVLQMETAVSGQKPQTLDIAVAEGNLAINGHPEGAMVYRGKDETVLAISHVEDAYTVIDRKSLQRVAATVNPLLEQLERMPPEYRAQIERMVGAELPGPAGPPADTRVHETGRTDEISGYECVWWEVEENGVKLREMCITPLDGIPEGDELMAVVSSMSDFYEQVLSEFSADLGFAVRGNPLADISEMNGFPVKARSFRGKALESETVMKAAAATPVDAAIFQPPKGYEKRSIPGIG